MNNICRLFLVSCLLFIVWGVCGLGAVGDQFVVICVLSKCFHLTSLNALNMNKDVINDDKFGPG